MDLGYLTLEIEYNTKTSEFKLGGNIKSEQHAEIISNFLRTQIGAGRDDRQPVQKEVYNITLCVGLDDSFDVIYNTGNKGLRDGILLDVLRRLDRVEE